MSKVEAVLQGRHSPSPERLRTSPPTHQRGGLDIPHQLLKNQVSNPPTQKGPGRSRTTKSYPQGSTRRRLAMENQDHPTSNGIRQQTGCICRTSRQVCKKFSLSRTCTHGEQRLNRWVLQSSKIRNLREKNFKQDG